MKHTVPMIAGLGLLGGLFILLSSREDGGGTAQRSEAQPLPRRFERERMEPARRDEQAIARIARRPAQSGYGDGGDQELFEEQVARLDLEAVRRLLRDPERRAPGLEGDDWIYRLDRHPSYSLYAALFRRYGELAFDEAFGYVGEFPHSGAFWPPVMGALNQTPAGQILFGLGQAEGRSGIEAILRVTGRSGSRPGVGPWEGVPGERATAELFRLFAFGWSKRDPGEAVAWVLEEAPVRWAGQALEADIFDGLPAGSDWAGYARRLEEMGSDTEVGRVTGAWSLGGRWVREDPDSALQWLESLDASGRVFASDGLVDSALSRWLEEDPGSAGPWLREHATTVDLGRILSADAPARQRLEAARAIGGDFGNEVAMALLRDPYVQADRDVIEGVAGFPGFSEAVRAAAGRMMDD